NDSQRTKSDDEGDDFVHPNLSTYKADEEEEEKDEEKSKDDDEVTSDQKVSTPPDYELMEEDINQEDDDTIGEDQEDEENGELYGDLNLNLDRQDVEMTDAQTNQETEEAHMTLTTEPPVVQQQSSSISSDLVAKFIKPSLDTCIDLILNPNVAVSITPSSATIIPQTSIPIIQPQQQTHDFTTTTTLPTTTVLEILKFASLFGFEHRVSLLESDLSELKQTNQFAEALSSISGIVDKYLASKVKDTVDVAVQLKSDKLREEAQAENQDFLNSLDSNMKRIIKEQIKAQTSKIMTKVEKYVTKTLGAEVLVRSTNQPQTSDVQKNLYRALLKAYNSDKDLLSSYGEVVTLKRGHDDQDKDEEPSAGSNRGSSLPKSSGKSVQEEEHDPRVDDLEKPFHQEFDTGNEDVSPIREAIDVDERLWNPSGSRTPDQLEPNKDDWHNPEGRPYLHDLSKPLPLILDARGRQIIPYDHFINNDLEYLKGGSSSRQYKTSITKIKDADYGHVKWIEDKIPRSTWSEIMEFFVYKHLEEITVRRQDDMLYKFREGDFKRLHCEDIEDMLLLLVQEHVEDLQLAVESYQKKINLTKPDTYRIDLRKMTPYTAYRDIQGIIYQDDMDRNRLMGTDELHKFSDGTLNHVCTSLNDIAIGIQMEYFSKRKWSKQDKQRA
ncbi:hypothetical protein Tco_1040325, partial [Tanacetum coccineum]